MSNIYTVQGQITNPNGAPLAHYTVAVDVIYTVRLNNPNPPPSTITQTKRENVGNTLTGGDGHFHLTFDWDKFNSPLVVGGPKARIRTFQPNTSILLKISGENEPLGKTFSIDMVVNPIEAPWLSGAIVPSVDIINQMAMAIGSDGVEHICYFDKKKNQLIYARREGIIWNRDTVDDLDNFVLGVPVSLAIAVDKTNTPHIVYNKVEQIGNFPQGKLMYSKKENSVWPKQMVDSGQVGEIAVGWSNSIAVDHNNIPHISYVTADNGGAHSEIKYAHRNGGWHIKMLRKIEGGNIYEGRSTSIAVDDTSMPHISYTNHKTNKLEYAKMNNNNNNDWNFDTVAGTGQGLWRNAIVLDNSQVPHICYYNPVKNSLEYAKKENNGWNRDTIAAGIDPMASLSIAIDPVGKPHAVRKLHISCYDANQKNLMYATKSKDKWINEVVEAQGDVGKWNAIGVGLGNAPHILYFDDTENQIKYAVKI